MDTNDTTEPLLVEDEASMEEQPSNLERRVLALEDKFERRGYNTRPLWEAAQEQIKALQEKIPDLEIQIRELQILANALNDSAFSSERELVCWVRFNYDDEIHAIPATRAEVDDYRLVVYRGEKVVAEIPKADIKRWWLADNLPE